ncbi:hypothetical protein Syncc9902_0108 [Synechococcus sp. CC9902]|nr:hypothetical protein Syncc9902_0108 [Synechococcus sp. CC9902]
MKNQKMIASLFTYDLEMARVMVREIVKKEKTYLHWSMSLGDYTRVSEALNSSELTNLEGELINGLRFRMARKMRNINPYEKILKLSEIKKERYKKDALSKGVYITGGIGDCLEIISTIKPWFSREGHNGVYIVERERYAQLRRFAEENELNIKSIMKIRHNERSVPSHLLLGALGQELPYAKSIIKKREMKDRKKYNLMCCWTAKGEGDKLSGWCRSIEFSYAIEIYKKCLRNGIKGEEILDISAWKDWEKEYLSKQGIKTYNPMIGDIKDMYDLITKSQNIITIDTALAHLSATMDVQTNLMLNKYHDERWEVLLTTNSSYRKNCRVIKQVRYGDWKEPIDKLSEILKINS